MARVELKINLLQLGKGGCGREWVTLWSAMWTGAGSRWLTRVHEELRF